jgi:predicted type IV restriction endonuclease
MEFKLNLPSYEVKLREENLQKQIFDPIRRKYVALTPEEWVRQHFINYLTIHKGFSKGLLSIEHLVNVNNMPQRADIVAYNRNGQALLIVECKAPSVQLTKEVYEQAARYNLSLKAEFLVVTNGLNHFCSRIDLANFTFTPLKEIPPFIEITA